MEEILSSIKRIIAEDHEPPAPRARRTVAAAPVADATPLSVDDNDADAGDASVLELTDTVAEEPQQPMNADTPPPAAPEMTVAAPAPRAAEPVLSDETLHASKSALSALSAMVVKPDANGPDTLEGLVREMLRPMLREWLDARLPGIVERLVAAEIAKLSRD